VITEWGQLEGRTIKKVVEYPFEGCFLYFEGGEVALITGDGEERHGQHWPILSDHEVYLQEAVSSDG